MPIKQYLQNKEEPESKVMHRKLWNKAIRYMLIVYLI